MHPRRLDKMVALLAASLCHGAFALAVGSMAVALATGLQWGGGRLTGSGAVIANLALILQFPLLHSFLLSRRGSGLLRRLAPGRRGGKLQLTLYVLIGSCQLLLTFWAWSPSGVVWRQPHGVLGAAQWAAFAGAWVFLIKALHDAGLGVQSGAAGWLALWRDRAVEYGGMPTHGLFATCRQPIYLGFASVLWTAPVWSADLVLLVFVWSGYCILGPLHKEHRWQARHGERFADYKRMVPYFFPRLKR